MSDKNTILGYFQTNDTPTESQYASWIIDTYDCIDNLALHISAFNHDDIATTKAKVDAMVSAVTIFNASNGEPNIAIGSGALGEEVELYINGITIPEIPDPIGYKNIVVGKNSYRYNISGHSNVCMGMYSSVNTLDSNFNISLGHGNLLGVGGDSNIVIGHDNLTYVTCSASDNIIVGSNCLNGLTLASSAKNIVIGKNSGNNLNVGENNIILGFDSVVTDNTSQCIFIGNNSDVTTAMVNSVVIGYGATCSTSNTIMLGNLQTTDSKLAGILDITSGTINLETQYRINTDGAINIKGIATKVKLAVFGVHYLKCNDHIVLGNATVADVEIFLPSSTDQTITDGHQYIIKKIDNSINEVKISPEGSDQMEGLVGGFYTLSTEGQSVTFVFYNNKWYII